MTLMEIPIKHSFLSLVNLIIGYKIISMKYGFIQDLSFINTNGFGAM